MLFPKTILVRSPQHLEFVASLPCLITGREGENQAHHLLRGTGEKAGGQKAGDDKTIPLHFTKHDALHRSPLGETRYLERNGVPDPLEVAAMLYEYTMDYDAAHDYIRRHFEKNWKLNAISY